MADEHTPGTRVGVFTEPGGRGTLVALFLIPMHGVDIFAASYGYYTHTVTLSDAAVDEWHSLVAHKEPSNDNAP